MKFEEFNLDDRLQKAISDAGFIECMPVQEESFKYTLEGRDILAQSQTGTGKTAAFLIASFQLILHNEKFQGKKALIIVPTRELAVQIEKEAMVLSSGLDLKIGAVFGGVGYKQQEALLSDNPDVIIGTPGRLLDFSKSRKLDMSNVGICIVDEADRLFDMGFYPDLRKMLKLMPEREAKLNMLYSATLNTRVENLAWEFMNDPGKVVIEAEQVTVEAIEQKLYHVGKGEKFRLLLGLLNKHNPENALIFTNTKWTAEKIAKKLEINGYHTKYLMGDLPQNKRMRILEDVKSGKIKYLVATDVAARGLHINDLELVVNYDLPNEDENYVHRIGRTARAGKKGKAISLACEEFVFSLQSIEDYCGMKIPVTWAEESDYAEDKSQGMKFSSEHRRRDPRDSRDSGRGDRNPRGDRRPRGDNRRRKEPPRNARPHKPVNLLDESASKVQSQVSMVSGSHILKEDKTVSSGKSENRNRKNQQGSGKQKVTRTRNQNKGRSTVATNNFRKNPPPRVTSDTALDERLAYYRKKYGEDFSPADDKKQPTGKNQPREPKRRQKVERKQTNQGKQTSTDTNRNKVTRKQTVVNKQTSNGKKSQEKKKGGFFSRLFGKK